MKRKGRKTESGIRELKVDIEKQVKEIASKAEAFVHRKSDWVAAHVEKAIHKVEQEADTLEIVVDKELKE